MYGTAPTIANFEDRSSVIPRDLYWTDVLADIVAGMGYDPAIVWPGFARRAIGLIK